MVDSHREMCNQLIDKAYGLEQPCFPTNVFLHVYFLDIMINLLKYNSFIKKLCWAVEFMIIESKFTHIAWMTRQYCNGATSPPKIRGKKKKKKRERAENIYAFSFLTITVDKKKNLSFWQLRLNLKKWTNDSTRKRAHMWTFEGQNLSSH